MARPLVAIVGRPNVGKSTLFNRLAGQPLAIVSDVPGTTRDRVTSTVPFRDGSLILVDTGGIETAPASNLWEQVRAQVEIALNDSDAIIFLTDVVDGVTPSDIAIAQSLRERGKPIALAVNKVDNPRRELDTTEFYSLGLGDPLPISAYHNLGVRDLLSRLDELLPEQADDEEDEAGLRLAIVGRPNVGKSMLLNSILGHERVIVSDMPGTTRDAVDIPFTFDDELVTLIDTAGLRRRGRIEQGIEQYSVLRAVRAIERSNVCLLVIDGMESITAQDTHVAGYVTDAYKGVVVVVNKWDMAGQETDTEWMESEVRRRLRFVSHAPVRFTSALTGAGVLEVMETALHVYEQGRKMVSRGALDRTLMNALSEHLPSGRGRRSLKVFRMYQKGVSPPTFVTFVNNPELVHFSYQRYLENRLRSAFGFAGNPIHLIFSTRGRRR
ncbi:MAG: ribosome biogenesis GTPase Der [Chloroflexota bacterium]|nr:ribosome biogenesis GTPase Der [Chloroflexota bacterium]MDE2941346.1 ribosome biogenesis GTPase Der [Chloroflexota bacterium]MDE3267445.1 ribosome biogenesis GTPase Der [Chloroflexota bacterium]